jgi:hypothetical protein
MAGKSTVSQAPAAYGEYRSSGVGELDSELVTVTVTVSVKAGRVSTAVEVKSSVTTAPEAVIVTSLTLVIITVDTEIDVTVERLGHVEDVGVVELVVDSVPETELEVECTSE